MINIKLLQQIIIIYSTNQQKIKKMNIQHQYNTNNKNKAIPYSKIVYDQLIDQDDEDCCIPDQYNIRNVTNNNNKQFSQQTNTPNNINMNINKQRNGYNNICYENENENENQNENNIKQIYNDNSYNRTFTSGTFNNINYGYQYMIVQDDRKKLTYGLTNYKDIKNATVYANNSNNSRSGSKNKKIIKIDQDNFNRNQKQLVQCTFTPKTNNYKPGYRNFKQFTDFQQEFVNKKQAKLRKIKQHIQQIQSANHTGHPSIDKNSRRMSQLAQSYATMLNYDTTQYKNMKKLPCHERLYNIPKKKQGISSQQVTFTPKILNKSKNMQRNQKIQNLLYQDAQRRQGQQKLAQSQTFKRQSLTKKFPPNIPTQKQAKNNNKLLCNKIRAQFLQLLQIQTTQQDSNNINDTISPILAITILSQLFNVELDPNKNQQLCLKVINYLVSYEIKNINQGERNGYVQINKLWDFIKAIVVGADGSECGIIAYNQQEVNRINEELGYFYSQRLLKWPTRFQEQNENQPQYKIQASEKTNRLAQKHRSKKLERISEFLQQNKLQVPKKTNAQSKQKQNEKEVNKDIQTPCKKQMKQKTEKTQTIVKDKNTKQQKILRLQDMLILDSIRHKTQMEKKRIQKQEEQLKNCTFKPVLNDKQIQKMLQRRQKSKQNGRNSARNSCSKNQNNYHTIKTQVNQQVQQKLEKNYDSIEKVKKIVNKINTIENKIPNPQKILKKKQNDNQNNILKTQKKPASTSLQKKLPQSDTKQEVLTNIKDADKIILRYSLARKMKNAESAAKQRGYNGNSSNWLKQIQQQKKQILGQLSNFLGYTGKNHSKQKQSKRIMNRTLQQYQSNQIKVAQQF